MVAQGSPSAPLMQPAANDLMAPLGGQAPAQAPAANAPAAAPAAPDSTLIKE